MHKVYSKFQGSFSDCGNVGCDRVLSCTRLSTYPSTRPNGVTAHKTTIGTYVLLWFGLVWFIHSVTQITFDTSIRDSSSSSSSYGATTFNVKFWPSQPVPFIFYYPELRFSNLALLTSVYLF
jgi:hypothetical protein